MHEMAVARAAATAATIKTACGAANIAAEGLKQVKTGMKVHDTS